MHSRSIHTAFLGVALLACASCSRSDQQPGGSDEAASTDARSPNIAPSAAPGVAFRYDYQFTLRDDRISAAQEAHAAACEKLGLSRCRITGMSFSVDQDEQVRAELDLKLDPAIARQFGKSAQQLVERNDGKLLRLDIGSSDEGSVIQQANSERSDPSARLAQLQDELSRTRPGTAQRADLLRQIQALEQQIQQQGQAISASQAALASTPMEFHYYGEGGVPGFRGNPAREAWRTFLTTVVWLVHILLQALAVLAPLALLIALLVAIWRTRPLRALRGWFVGRRASGSDDGAAPNTPPQES